MRCKGSYNGFAYSLRCVAKGCYNGFANSLRCVAKAVTTVSQILLDALQRLLQRFCLPSSFKQG